VRYWDSSALLPLVVKETATARVQALLAEDGDVLTWWGSRVEAHSALARLARDRQLALTAHHAAVARLESFAASWNEVIPSDAVRDQAARLLRLHPLRSGDALQLAAAVVVAEHRPGTLPLVTLDGRLREAAEKEGFPVGP
jgi:hypothetical protein